MSNADAAGNGELRSGTVAALTPVPRPTARVGHGKDEGDVQWGIGVVEQVRITSGFDPANNTVVSRRKCWIGLNLVNCLQYRFMESFRDSLALTSVPPDGSFEIFEGKPVEANNCHKANTKCS
jgi:hypothetical protein